MNEYRGFNVNIRFIETEASRFEVLLAALGLSVIAVALAAAVAGADTISPQLFRALAAAVAALGAGALLWEAVKWEKPEGRYPKTKESVYQPVPVKSRTQRGSKAA